MWTEITDEERATYREYRARHDREIIQHKKLYFRKYAKNRYATNPCFKIAMTQRSRIRAVIKRSGAVKKSKSFELLGCNAKQLKRYLESLWSMGMNWNNYGFRGWHIDHIRPLCSFDLKKHDQQKIAFHYMNLQPLWAKDNLTKSGRYQETQA